MKNISDISPVSGLKPHGAVIRAELVAEFQEVEIGAVVAERIVAVNRDALAFVNAVLDGVALHGEGRCTTEDVTWKATSFSA